MQASGRLESIAGGVARDFQTDAQGNIVLGNLPFGRYRLQVSKSGFTTQSVTIDVQSATPVTRSISMEIGAQAAKVDVVSETPLAGTDLQINQIAAPVQTATAADIENSGALDLGDFHEPGAERRVSSTKCKANPFQPDVNYRGYTASPLLGTPEGISVYVDGVRQNQPFGDVVSWDLIPKDAISEMALIPGSDPLFGLNTLGGAISVTTKSGLTNPGWAGDVLYGSSGRKEVEGEWGGGKATGFNWFLSGTRISRIGLALTLRHPMSARDSRGWVGAPARPISRSPCRTPTIRCSATASRITGCWHANYTSGLFGFRQHSQSFAFV